MKKKRAFTLSELMLATAILVIVITGLLAAFVGCLILNESNNNLVKAANDAQYVLEQIKGVAYSNIGAYVPPVFNNLGSETITLNRNIGVKIAEVTVNVAWVERQKNRNFSLSTRIAR